MASLPDFDLLSRHADREARDIEIKGRAGGGAYGSRRMETCLPPGERYRLYIAFDGVALSPQLLRVRVPFVKLLADLCDGAACALSAAALRKAAGPERRRLPGKEAAA